MRASVRSRTAGYAGGVHAEILGYPYIDGRAPEFPVHLLRTVAKTNRSDGGDLERSRDVCSVDASSAVRLRREFSAGQVPAGSEQDHGDGGHSGGGASAAHRV